MDVHVYIYIYVYLFIHVCTYKFSHLVDADVYVLDEGARVRPGLGHEKGDSDVLVLGKVYASQGSVCLQQNTVNIYVYINVLIYIYTHIYIYK